MTERQLLGLPAAACCQANFFTPEKRAGARHGVWEMPTLTRLAALRLVDPDRDQQQAEARDRGSG